MKKLGLLIAVAFTLTACDTKPGGNKGVLPLNQQGIEEVDPTANVASETPAVQEEATPDSAEVQPDDTIPQDQPAEANEETETGE